MGNQLADRKHADCTKTTSHNDSSKFFSASICSVLVALAKCQVPTLSSTGVFLQSRQAMVGMALNWNRNLELSITNFGKITYTSWSSNVSKGSSPELVYSCFSS